MGRSVAAVYATAFLQSCENDGTLEKAVKDVELVLDTLNAHPEVFLVLSHPDVSVEEKSDVLLSVFSGKLLDSTNAFLTVVLEKKRESSLTEILKKFLDMAKEKMRIGSVKVVSASELSPEQKEKVEQKIAGTTSFERLTFTYEVDPSLIGGIVIRIGDRVADGSVKNRLRLLKEDLLTTRA